ncbi:extracellular solute-binding protein [Methylocystis sp. MJC1]|jgi:peptide/nickel transport system substrate-binding protein|uniref:extracellular solute-binding protein n=1 Tax=Methylocystis sp. MJC1 TaxID=2654282 RepID=UPI0013EAB5A5|nr:extracellular solute-binding protein [Methylocystis sp. MJC1]KAF2989646.1 Oligopeptide-binding protein AppA [Methylocystis sp. MJC1]MBU6525646.1 ABC transporter substrate-binding protein [Methylocystis sp. MJC1]UZX12120.1 extracellular solute-binding protein [Methylocystis sp. MJC1]
MISSAIRGRQKRRRLPCLVLAALFAAIGPLAADEPTHGLATHGAPALPPDFDHFPYADPQAKKGGKLRVGLAGTFDSLNPFNLKSGSTAQGLVGNVFQGMMARSQDEPFTLYPLIAQSLDIDAARARVTFHLDPRAHFSDGKPITSEDVLFSFDLLKSKGRPQQRIAYGLVKAITAPDAQTVSYDLTGVGDRELPLILAIMPVLPKHATDLERFSDATLAKPVGSGPYIVADAQAGARLLLKRAPNYWGADVPSQRGFYNFDEIDIQYFRDGNSLFEAFKAGLLDYREETSTTRWSTGYDFPALREGRVATETLKNENPKGLEGFVFNTRRPIFTDIRLREALGMMFDFEWVNANLYSNLYTRTKSFFDESELSSSGRPASEKERALLVRYPDAVRADILDGKWRPPINDGSGRDREMAKRALELLASAGYRVDGDKLAKDGEPVSFEIMVKDRNQERLALNYAASLARIGVEARVRLVDEVQYQRRRQKFDFDMMIGQYLASASPGNEQRMRWGSASAKQESSFNLAGAASPAIDALIAALLSAQSQEDFVAAVRAYDRVLLSGFYVVPLFHASEQWIAHSTDIARPGRLPRYAAPLFGPTLESWWRKTP